MMYRSFLWVLLGFVSCYAQIDKRFWFAAPDIDNTHADRPIYLRVAAINQKANVRISIPANKQVLAEFIINTNSVQTIDLTGPIESIENDSYDAVSKKGILIESDQEITAYYEVRGISEQQGRISNSDIYPLKGSNALGMEFLLPLQNFWRAAVETPGAYASFQIVATEDKTTVEIMPTQALSKHSKGVAFKVLLNRGEVYTERAASPDPALRPTGTIIKSDKKVAVTITDDSMYDETFIIGGWGAWDMGGDQLVPVEKAGTSYIINKINADTAALDRIFVTGIEDGTQITMNGTHVGAVNRSETKAIVLREALNLLQSSKAVYVLHVGGFGSELAAALLPPMACTGSKKVSLALNDASGAYLSIVVPRGGEGSFILNGKQEVLTSDYFVEMPYDSNFLCAKIPLGLMNVGNQVVVENATKSFQLGLLNQEESGTFAYGYFSDFGTLDLPDTATICPGKSAMLHGGFGKDVYAWYKDQVFISDSSVIEVYDEGLYLLKAQKGSCMFVDSTRLVLYETDRSLFERDSVAFCYNQKDSIGVGNNFRSYRWNTGQLSSKIWPIRDQIYVLNVIDGNGCEVRDQIKVSTYPMDTLKVVVPSEDVYCGVSICVPIAMRAGYQSYSINDTLLMNPDVCWPRNKAHAYSVKVVDEFGCIQGHTFVYDCSVYLGPIPNIITPKEPDGLNDTFAVQGLLGEYWQLHVYNRYGVRVFESKHYNNDWDASGEGAGIYFYELTHKDKNITYKGWVEVR